MASTMFQSLVTVHSEPPQLPSSPAKAVPRSYPGAPQSSDSIELELLRHAATTTLAEPVSVETGRAPSPGDLEMSRPATPLETRSEGDDVEALQGIRDPFMNQFRLLAACLMNFGNGLSDSAPGPLIPSMEEHFNVGYGIISLIFVGTTIGFITAALLLDSLREQLGRARTLALGQTLMAVGYLPILCGAPFPAVVVGFILFGFGEAVNVAIGNLFCGSLRRATAALGTMHACYGAGGTLGPLAATAIIRAAGPGAWAKYYYITLALTLFNAGFAAWAFWGYEAEQSSGGSGRHITTGNGVERSGGRAVEEGRARLTGMFTALASRTVALGAVFIFAYQGAEVSISGWVISFLIATRHGDPAAVGNVTAGFWAGITLGRLALSGAPAKHVGEKRFVYGLVVGAAVFEALVWSVPNIVGDAVAVAVVGLLLGPVYPCAAAIFMRLLDRREKLNGMGVISAFGSSGGAAAPFTTGILAQAVGTFVLHPIAIGLFSVMMGCWYLLPNPRKRTE